MKKPKSVFFEAKRLLAAKRKEIRDGVTCAQQSKFCLRDVTEDEARAITTAITNAYGLTQLQNIAHGKSIAGLQFAFEMKGTNAYEFSYDPIKESASFMIPGKIDVATLEKNLNIFEQAIFHQTNLCHVQGVPDVKDGPYNLTLFPQITKNGQKKGDSVLSDIASLLIQQLCKLNQLDSEGVFVTHNFDEINGVMHDVLAIPAHTYQELKNSEVSRTR